MSGDRRKSSSWFNIALQASAGPIGLAIGYVALCQIGPQYDFLRIWGRGDQPNAAISTNANSGAGRQLRKGAPKPSLVQLNDDEGRAAAKALPSEPAASIVTAPMAVPASDEIATRSPLVERALSLPTSPDGRSNEDHQQAADNSTEQRSNEQPRRNPIGSVAEIQQTILKCRTAREACQLLSGVIADTSPPEEARTYAKSQLATWESRAANDYVRLGENWLPRSDATSRRENANALVVQAAALLSLNNEQPALERLRQARNVDPEATNAGFLLGVHYALGQQNYQTAKEHFADCLRRKPDDLGALNDLALAKLMLGKYSEALKDFRSAAAINSQSAALAHNLRRILKQDGLKILVLPPSEKKGFAELISHVISDETVLALDNLGWLYILPTATSAAESLPPEVPNVLLRFAAAQTDKTVKIHAQWIEDCQCPWCHGAGKAPCSNPDCNNGQVIVKRGQEVVGKDPATKKNIYRDTFGPKNCPTCKGTAYLSCEKCSGLRIDPTLSGMRIEVFKR